MVRYCRRFNVFEAFSCKIRDPHVFSHSGIKVAESLHLDLKISFSLQYCKSFYSLSKPLVLKSNESLPKYGKTKVNSLEIKVFSDK